MAECYTLLSCIGCLRLCRDALSTLPTMLLVVSTAHPAVDLALKDVRYMRQLAESSRSPLRTADLVFNSLLQASANGYGKKDVGAMFLATQQAAGLLTAGKHLQGSE